ncbi:MAG TPA: lipopolysaccharide transport periplasmic protein LptA [Casimicrobiaceae bacterium]|jgi:lipopolysaccharide export system protein LptA
MYGRLTIRKRVCGHIFAFATLVVAPAAFAEKADKEKPINFSAEQPAEVDFEKRVGTLKGNVVITQGTITIRADRIDFKQNADNSMSATAYGNPITFRQKKDDSDEYYEGYAQRAVYDGQKDLLELFDRALLKQGNDEIRSNYISYNSSTGIFRAEGRPNAPGVSEGPGERVRGVFQPKSDSPLGKDLTKDGKSEGTAPAKGKSGDAKDKAEKAAAKSKDKAPVTLKPTDELKQ